MTIDPTRYSGPPAEPRSEQENAIYARLTELGIPFYRVDHEHADTMEDCLAIEKVLGGKICKNLFLCNRQGTRFYLLMMPGDKPFKTKYLYAQLGCARLSFADSEAMMQYLGVEPGSVSILGLMNDAENQVRLLIDEDVLKEELFGCHPCTNTSSIRFSTKDMMEKLIPALGNRLDLVHLVGVE